jgi:DNA-binding transcriptional MerR regulator
MQGLSIGDAARSSGVKIPTIRYYEEIGLLNPPPRSEGNRRLYDDKDLRKFAFIRHARELGFEVDAIRTLLSLQENPNQSCGEADQIARARLAEVEQKLFRLSALKEELQRMVDHCATGRVSGCRVIEILADQTHEHGRLD